MDARHQRSHVDVCRVASADFQLLRALQHARHEVVGATADGDSDRDRHAALACRAIGGADQRVRGAVEVGVGHYHHVVLRPAQGLHAFAVGDALRLDVLRDRRRTDEGHGLYVRVFEQGIDRFLVALHHVEGSCRQAGFAQQFGGEHRGRRVALGGLEDEGVAAGQRHRRHPHRHHEGKVEGRNAGRDAQRHALAPVVDAAADAVRMLALEELRDAAGEFDDFQPALYLAQRIGQCLAVLGGEQLGDVGRVLVDQIAELEHDAGAALRRGRAPVGKGGAGGSHGAVDVGAGSQRNLPCDFTLSRVEYIATTGAAAGIGLALDPVADEVGGVNVLKAHGFSCVLHERRPLQPDGRI